MVASDKEGRPGRRDVVAAVLAGGASRRMGRDKAAEPVGGAPSLERVVRAAEAVVGEVIVVGGERPDAVADVEPGGGPLQGLLAAFRARPGRDLLALACDLPLLSPELLERVCAPLPADRDARVLVLDGRLQPLCALYRGGTAATFEAAWADGVRGPTRALARLSVERLDAGGLPELQRLAGRDFDTPRELAALLTAASSVADVADVDVEAAGAAGEADEREARGRSE